MDIREEEAKMKKCNQLKSSRLIPTIFFSSFTFHFATLFHHIFFRYPSNAFLSHVCFKHKFSFKKEKRKKRHSLISFILLTFKKTFTFIKYSVTKKNSNKNRLVLKST